MSIMILEALQKLDPANNDDWTGDGLPTVIRMQELTGDASLTRQQITAANPAFSRMNMAPLENTGEPQADPDASPEVTEEPVTETPSSEKPPEEPEEPASPEVPDETKDDTAKEEAATDMDEMAVLKEELEELNIEMDTITKRRDEVTAALDKLIVASTDAYDPKGNQKAIQTFIKSQNQQRLNRATRRKQLIAKLSDDDLKGLVK